MGSLEPVAVRVLRPNTAIGFIVTPTSRRAISERTRCPIGANAWPTSVTSTLARGAMSLGTRTLRRVSLTPSARRAVDDVLCCASCISPGRRRPLATTVRIQPFTSRRQGRRRRRWERGDRVHSRAPRYHISRRAWRAGRRSVIVHTLDLSFACKSRRCRLGASASPSVSMASSRSTSPPDRRSGTSTSRH